MYRAYATNRKKISQYKNIYMLIFYYFQRLEKQPSSNIIAVYHIDTYILQLSLDHHVHLNFESNDVFRIRLTVVVSNK